MTGAALARHLQISPSRDFGLMVVLVDQRTPARVFLLRRRLWLPATAILDHGGQLKAVGVFAMSLFCRNLPFWAKIDKLFREGHYIHDFADRSSQTMWRDDRPHISTLTACHKTTVCDMRSRV